MGMAIQNIRLEAKLKRWPSVGIAEFDQMHDFFWAQ